MQDAMIDLSLAVNYLPACSCALRAVLLSFALCGIHSVKLLPAFVPVCLLLVFNRAQHPVVRIFDSTGLLFSIFLSHCVALLQERGEGWWTLWNPLYVALSLEWPAAAAYLMYKPPARHAEVMWYLAAACCHASAFAFVHRGEGPENRLVRVGRDLSFTGLCLFWTYVVGIYRRRLSRDPSDSASHFAVYFWPVLFAHPYAACFYALGSFAAICAQLRPSEPSSYEMPHVASYPPEDFHVKPSVDQATAAAAPQPITATTTEGPLPDMDDEELFRQAMGARSSV